MVLPTPYCHSERSEESSAPCPRPRGSEKQTLRVAQGDRANHCGKIISHGGVRIPSPSSLHFRKTCHSRHQSSGIQVFISNQLFNGRTIHWRRCLNPFFVRSSFQTWRFIMNCPVCKVLIPSSSGLHFKLENEAANGRRLEVLIPSSSGLHFKPRFKRFGKKAVKVLIPSSSGLHFKRPPTPRSGGREMGLNPFFVRSSFQTRTWTETSRCRRGS